MLRTPDATAHRLTMLAARPHLPRRTVRLRLTLVYGGLFLVSGAALLAITYALVVHATEGIVFKSGNLTGYIVGSRGTPSGSAPTGQSTRPGSPRRSSRRTVRSRAVRPRDGCRP